MKRRGHGAQEWWGGTREEASLTRYSIAKDGSPMLGQTGQLVVSNTGASPCTYSDNVYDRSTRMPNYGGCWLFSSDMHVPDQVGAKYDKGRRIGSNKRQFCAYMVCRLWAETTPVAFHA